MSIANDSDNRLRSRAVSTGLGTGTGDVLERNKVLVILHDAGGRGMVGGVGWVGK